MIYWRCDFRVKIISAILFLLVSIFSVLYSEIVTSNFFSTEYKDTIATTASWGFSGIVTLPISRTGLVNLWTASGTPYGNVEKKVVMQGNYAYLSALDTDPYFAIYDISNPSNVSMPGACTGLTSGYQGRGFVIHDTAVYLPTWSVGTLVIDITDKTNPIVVGTISGEPGGYTSGLVIKDNTTMFGIQRNTCNVVSYQITGDTKPKVVTSLNISSDFLQGIRISYSNNYCYLSRVQNDNLYDSFCIIDISNPSALVLKKVLHMNSGPYATANCILGDYAFIATGAGDTILRCVDITNPLNPFVTGYTKTTGAGGVREIRRWANYVFLGGQTKSFIVDISDTTRMDTVCTFNFPASDLDVQNGYVFLCYDYPKMFRINFNDSAVVQSKTVVSTTEKISGATLTASETIPVGAGIDYFMSSNGGLNWEGPVTKGTRWNFLYPGTDLRWKAVMSTTNNVPTPEISGVTIDYVHDIINPVWTGDITLKTYIDRFDTQLYSSVISWNSAIDLSHVYYYIEKNTDGTGWTYFDTTTALSDTITNLSSLSKYKFRVKIIDVIGNSSEWREISDEVAPTWIPNFQIKESEIVLDGSIAKYSLMIYWEKATDNTGDMVHYEVESKLGESGWKKESFSAVNAFQMNNVDVRSENEIRVRARDVAGNSTEWSELEIASRFMSDEIGANGGKIYLDDRDGNSENDAGLEIPSSALDKKVRFKLFRFSDEVYDFKAFDSATDKEIKRVNFKNPVVIIIPYKKDLMKMSGWDESQLGILYHDGTRWVPIGGIVDSSNSVVKARVFHFTLFKVGKVRGDGKGGMQISVNPEVFTPNGDGINDEIRFNLVLGDELLDKNGIISIYDVNGKICKVIVTQQATSIVWDGIDDLGCAVESGIYVYRLLMLGRTSTGTFCIAK